MYYGPDGKQYEVKPEELTHLYGNRLTEKDNPVIVFRGKLDTLCAMILEARLLGIEKENPAFANDMQEILEFTRTILPAEYKGTPMGEFRVLGLSSSEVQEQSQHPDRYFGHKHLLMDSNMGPLSVRLNLLRAFVREVELAAVTVFKDPDSPFKSRRVDIVEALNRLSSLFYILIYKYLPAGYSPSGDAGI
jgi:ethanolamine utilization cobalamin adenosyltransferase